jgi:hypothetical protein
MTLIIIMLVVLFVIGRGGFWGHRSSSYDGRAYLGIPGLAPLLVVVFFVSGAVRNGFH